MFLSNIEALKARALNAEGCSEIQLNKKYRTSMYCECHCILQILTLKETQKQCYYTQHIQLLWKSFTHLEYENKFSFV